MNIQERYWKWKRAFNKKKDTIGRIISILLIVALVAVVGYTAYNIRQSDLYRAKVANQDIDKTTIKTIKNPNYGDPGFQKVAENDKLILSADFTTGEISVTEKASGMVWYSNPQDRDSDTYATMKTRLHAQMHVKFVNLEKGIKVEYDNYANSIKKGRMEHELIENGVKFTFGFTTANVFIPVQYFLTEDGFQAEIVVDEIEGVGYNPFMIESIALLPFFGAGSLNDEGYLMVPDGSGALINFNNDKQSRQVFTEKVYGSNPTLALLNQETVREKITLPVFGAKVNNNAFMGIIISGDACSSISATTSKKDSAYNHIYACADITEYSLKYNERNSAAHVESHTIGYSKHLTEGANYAVRYFFLEGDQANYTGMSNTYRDYLEKNNLLKKSELANEKYLVLDLVGAVSIKKYVFGILRPVVTALTTYDDVCEIVKELKVQGVDNIIINYIGAMNSGLNNKLYDKVKTESVLGSKKDFKNMISYLEQEGVLLFLESNPVDIYENGNGYNEKRDSAMTFFDKYAFQYNYELDLGTQIKDTRWHLLRPALASELAAKFAESLSDWNVKNISYAQLGNTIYADYNEDESLYTSRTTALKLWADAFKTADEATDYLMVHGGNAYTSPYADVITDVSDCHSNFDMEDQSVPFYQLTFQNNTLLTSNGINTTVDYEHAFLKALETGCSLKYNLIYGDVEQMVGTDYNTMVSYSYDYWKDVVVQQYKEMQEAVGQLAGKEILSHEFLTKDVTVTRYESAEVIVNYGTEAYTYNGQEIAARDYLILSGGAK